MDGSSEARTHAPLVHPAIEETPWHGMLDAHADLHGFHARLGHRHGALFTEDDDDTLLVTFENAREIRETSDVQLPYGLSVAGREGWSQLCFYSEGDTWFRDPEVYAFVDDLIDDGFFYDFDRVVFYGAGPAGYAAAAFSVASPGASLVLVRPQATQDPAVAGWDARYPEMRRISFTDRYGYAPDMIDGAADGVVIYDPAQREDAMHAALFTRDGIEKFACRFLGARTEAELENMDMLLPLLRAAGRGKLSRERFSALYRKRRSYPPYLRRVLSHLEQNDRTWLQGLWARAVLREFSGPRFRKGLKNAEAQLKDRGLQLPADRD